LPAADARIHGEADFFDLQHSAFFNSLPVARDGLLNEGAAAREYTMRFVRVPELTAEPARTSPSMRTDSSPSTRTISNGSGEAAPQGLSQRPNDPAAAPAR
jgi:hypothetical protein